MIILQLEDLRFNARLNTQPEVVQCIADVERGLVEFDQKFTETVIKNQLRDEIQSANQVLNNVTHTFIRSEVRLLLLVVGCIAIVNDLSDL